MVAFREILCSVARFLPAKTNYLNPFASSPKALTFAPPKASADKQDSEWC